jgi:hypothetical protein
MVVSVIESLLATITIAQMAKHHRVSRIQAMNGVYARFFIGSTIELCWSQSTQGERAGQIF